MFTLISGKQKVFKISHIVMWFNVFEVNSNRKETRLCLIIYQQSHKVPTFELGLLHVHSLKDLQRKTYEVQLPEYNWT